MQSHLSGGHRDPENRGRVGEAKPTDREKQQQFSVDSGQPRERTDDPIALRFLYQPRFDVRRLVAESARPFDWKPQPSPDDGAAAPPSCDGEDECVRRIRLPVPPPAMDQGAKAILGNLFCQATIAGSEQAVPDQPPGEGADGGVQIHANRVPARAVWSHYFCSSTETYRLGGRNLRWRIPRTVEGLLQQPGSDFRGDQLATRSPAGEQNMRPLGSALARRFIR
jgi:hypothetical protein